MKIQPAAFRPTLAIPSIRIETGSIWKERHLGGTAIVLSIKEGMVKFSYSDSKGVSVYRPEMRDWNFRNSFRCISR